MCRTKVAVIGLYALLAVHVAVCEEDAGQCYRCNNAFTNEDCQEQEEIQTCPEGDYGGCQSFVRTNGAGVPSITKQCKKKDVCLDEAERYKDQCTGFDVPQSICYCCCTSDLCNMDICNNDSDSSGTVMFSAGTITFGLLFAKMMTMEL